MLIILKSGSPFTAPIYILNSSPVGTFPWVQYFKLNVTHNLPNILYPCFKIEYVFV